MAGVLADRMASYIVGFGDDCAGAAPPELIFVSRDESPVRVRVWLPWRYDVMRHLVTVLYKDRQRRIVLPAAVRALSNGTDDKGDEINSFCCTDRYTCKVVQKVRTGHFLPPPQFVKS